MKSHLKVKVVSISHEMRYIRRQEEKWKNKARIARQKLTKMEKEAGVTTYHEKNFWSLRDHRNVMKKEARTTHLAYGFMLGRSYAQMEYICYGQVKGFGSCEPWWSKIEAMVERFSKDETDPQGFMQRYAEWLAEAKIWYEGNTMRIAEAMTVRDANRQYLADNKEYQENLKAFRAEQERLGRMAHDLVKNASSGMAQSG
jgi:hypothetical protein